MQSWDGLVVGHAAHDGQDLFGPLLAGEALLSPDKFTSPHGHGGQVAG